MHSVECGVGEEKRHRSRVSSYTKLFPFPQCVCSKVDARVAKLNVTATSCIHELAFQTLCLFDRPRGM